MCQKLGVGRVNSTATWGGPCSAFFTDTTRHSKCSPLFGFCMWILCLGTTNCVKAISAPCALTTRVCVFSQNCGPSPGVLYTTKGTFNSIRWLRRFFNHRLVVVGFSSYIQDQGKTLLLVRLQIGDAPTDGMAARSIHWHTSACARPLWVPQSSRTALSRGSTSGRILATAG